MSRFELVAALIGGYLCLFSMLILGCVMGQWRMGRDWLVALVDFFEFVSGEIEK